MPSPIRRTDVVSSRKCKSHSLLRLIPSPISQQLIPMHQLDVIINGGYGSNVCSNGAGDMVVMMVVVVASVGGSEKERETGSSESFRP